MQTPPKIEFQGMAGTPVLETAIAAHVPASNGEDSRSSLL